MFHLAVFNGSIAATALTQVAGLADPVIAPSGSGYLVNGAMPMLGGVAGVGGIMNNAQLSSASLRDYAPFDIDPVSVGTVVGSPVPMLDFFDNPLPLAVNEELDAYTRNSAATATQTSIIAWFVDAQIRRATGRFFSVRWTATATLVANAFTSFLPTLDNGIPSGTYALVGARAYSAGAIAFRFISRGGQSARPGWTATQAFSGIEENTQRGGRPRYGGLGEWLRFTNTTLPQIEMFSRSADTSEEGILDLLKVG